MRKQFFTFRISVLCLLILVIPLNAEAPYKKNLDIGNTDDKLRCSTSGLYDDKTAVTFFGDSRLDLVDSPFYGFSSLDHYFTTGGTWNVQNFGKSTMDSQGFKNQIQTCFGRDPANAAKPLYRNFKIAYNVAFEMGGNDFVNQYPFFIINPALYITRVPQTRDNIVSVIYTLQMRERNVLLVGNYPALSWSVRLGDPAGYAGYSGINPNVINAFIDIDHHKPIAERDLKFLTQVIKKLIIGSFMPFTMSIFGAVYSSLPGQEQSDLNSVYQDALHFVHADGTGQDDKNFARMATGSYKWWVTVSNKAVRTIPSLGVVLLENELRSVVNNPTAYGVQPFAYVSTGEAFLYPPAQFEPWVVNPNLMPDMIHKNHLGYAIWGKIVGDKIKELGWPNEKAVDDSLSSFKLNYQFNKRVLQILKERYEVRLAAISGDLDSNLESLRVNKEARITAANRNIASLTDQVAEIERIEQEAERERLRLIAEAERQRQEALAEYNRQQKIIVFKEKQRITGF